MKVTVRDSSSGIVLYITLLYNFILRGIRKLEIKREDKISKQCKR